MTIKRITRWKKKSLHTCIKIHQHVIFLQFVIHVSKWTDFLKMKAHFLHREVNEGYSTNMVFERYLTQDETIAH